MTINLSYVLTTYNKLDYLSVTLPLLINAKKEDEEIVVVDGGSTDGTKDYLNKLFSEKKIDQFISEKDFGEAHGTNKGFLIARGEIIKLITDDDVFHFPTIELCKKTMLHNKEIDMLGFDGLGFNMSQSANEYSISSHIEGFKKWKLDGTPFLFCGLSYTIRKTSLAHMGLFNPNFTMIDNEYSIRVSSMKTNICFYTGLGFVNIVNPNSNSSKQYLLINKEKKKLQKIYSRYRPRLTYKKLVLSVKDFIALRILKKQTNNVSQFNYSTVVEQSVIKLNQLHETQTSEFIFSKQ